MNSFNTGLSLTDVQVAAINGNIKEIGVETSVLEKSNDENKDPSNISLSSQKSNANFHYH